MTQAEMEDAIRNHDRRLSAIEQILPTLATKTDLERFATKADLERFATKADLESFAKEADRRFATKADLTAVREELRDELRVGFGEAKRHTDIRVEAVRDEIRIVADGVLSLGDKMDDLTRRLETKGVI